MRGAEGLGAGAPGGGKYVRAPGTRPHAWRPSQRARADHPAVFGLFFFNCSVFSFKQLPKMVLGTIEM